MTHHQKIKTVMLMQPNFSILNKRTWELPPYNLALINACLNDRYDSWIFDPNFSDMTEEEMRRELRQRKPDVVGITSFSTEYIPETFWYSALIKEELPDAILVLGGIIPTVMIDKVVPDTNIDYFIIGEGEYRFKQLLDALNAGGSDLSKIDGLAFRKNGTIIIQQPKCFIDDLDAVPYPDYSPLDIRKYGNKVHKYCAQLIPRKYPAVCTISTRGCPFNCIFCAAHTVSGKKVRMRSAENVLREIDILYNEYGMKEIIFLDDHFLASKKRAADIMRGIIQRNYDMTWKCGNVAVWSLNEELLELMRESGSYQICISPESGNQDVLDTIVKKPLDLKKCTHMTNVAKSLGFEIISNFIFGFPGETWAQIRDTIRYAEELDIEMVNFHIATPLPKTELMQLCIDGGFIKSEDDLFGYTKGVISTEEFTVQELQVLRAYEWDRINFRSEAQIKKIAQMEGLTLAEVQAWRRKTRRNLGITLDWKAKPSPKEVLSS